MADRRDRFVEELCQRHRSITLIFIVSVLFLILSLPYLVLTEPGSVLFTVSIMNSVGLVFFAALSGWILRTCSKRRGR